LPIVSDDRDGDEVVGDVGDDAGDRGGIGEGLRLPMLRL
jgi:hypothetical protein